MKVKYYENIITVHNCVFYINHKNYKVINYCIPGRKRLYEINMVNITSINFGKNNGNFVDKTLANREVKNVDENRCLTIRISKDFLDLIFESQSDLISFCVALMSFYTDNYIEKEEDDE